MLGDNRKVVSPAPIAIDPLWEEATKNAKKSAPKGLKLIARRQVGGAKQRRKRDAAIVQASENEIATADKVSLLVYSSLNDKNSMPGHLYRELIKKLKEHKVSIQMNEGNNMDISSKNNGRVLRDDTHAITKLVTAELLDVRPDFFCASPRITAISSSTVGAIVFGEIYEDVIEEIKSETSKIDKDLSIKISNFHIDRDKKCTNCAMCSIDDDNDTQEPSINLNKIVSPSAVEALKRLPQNYCIAEKLICIVDFLESISKECCIHGADSLLKKVCHHIVVARVDHLNAEMLLLEEFVQDENVLYGREGYAIVTIQASLKFMSESTNFEKDLFYDDNDEKG